jgi:UDP-N-acetylmuramyl pentapeptide synthase
MSPILPEVCNRTRMQASLRLDSELSELEEALMAAHLARCANCRSFADDLGTLTDTLRTAPLVEPSVEFQIPRRRLRFGIAQVGTAAAATITAAIALGGFVGLDPAPARISASDVESAHERMFLQEQLMQDMDTPNVPLRKRVPRGFEAAENAIVGATRSPQ